MAKYSKHNNDAKKIKQASKDYGTKSRSNIKENINQMLSSDSGKDSNARYDETTDPISSQHKFSDISDLSLFNNSARTEIKQSETNTINSPNKKSEELKPLVVYDMAAKDGISEADTSIVTKKSVSILPYDDKDEITSNPFLAAISLWQNYTNAWFRVWNEFFRYPTAITGEISFFRLNVFMQREERPRP